MFTTTYYPNLGWVTSPGDSRRPAPLHTVHAPVDEHAPTAWIRQNLPALGDLDDPVERPGHTDRQ